MIAPQSKLLSALLLAAVATCSVYSVPAPSPKSGKELSAQERRFLGEWKGQGGCAGKLILYENRKFEMVNWGPVASNVKGTWELRGDADTSTLVLTANDPDAPPPFGNKQELQILELDASKFVCKSGAGGRTIRYVRPDTAK